MSDVDRFVWLQAGLVVPVAAVEAVLAIERAGHRVRIDRDGQHLLIENRGAIDPDDLAALRKWKQHAILLLQYSASDRHLRAGASSAPALGPVVEGQ